MTRMIDADALNKKLCETTIFVKDGEKFQRMINDAPTIEPDGDTISRSRAIKDVSEWATDILHPDRLVKEDAIYILESLPSAEQVTGKLNNPDDSLLTADSEACKEQKSKLDLISRQDAISEIHKYFVEEIDKTPTETDDDGDELYADMPTVNSLLACNKELSKRIKSLPSAPDSRQRGEWVYGIDDETGEKDLYAWTCSVCNKEYPWQPNYCPNCGARMYKGGEDE